jgi:hypothetical protein
VHSINESLRDPARVLFHLMPTQPELEAVPCCDGILFVTLLSVALPSSSLLASAANASRGGGGAAGLLTTGAPSEY